MSDAADLHVDDARIITVNVLRAQVEAVIPEVHPGADVAERLRARIVDLEVAGQHALARRAGELPPRRAPAPVVGHGLRPGPQLAPVHDAGGTLRTLRTGRALHTLHALRTSRSRLTLHSLWSLRTGL